MNSSLQQIGNYLVWEEIARRGYMTLYRGYDPDQEHEVIVRLFHCHLAQNGDLLEEVTLYLTELQALTRIHPGIVPILAWDFVEHDKVYVVTPKLAGRKLADELEQRTYSEVETLYLLESLATIIDFAHQQGLVHGGLKPNNIFVLSSEDEPLKVQVCDFGMMTLLNLITRKADPTALGFGDAPYMSPEQARGGPDTPACNLYAMGVIAFYALTQEHPYDGNNTPDVLFHHLHNSIPDISDYRSDLTPALTDYFYRALAKSATARFASGELLAQSFRTLVIPPSSGVNPTWFVLFVCVAVAVLGVGCVVMRGMG